MDTFVLLGTEFKKQYGDVFYKFIDEKQINFTYKLGINKDLNKYNPELGFYQPAGLLFTHINNIINLHKLEKILAVIRIPDDSIVYINYDSFKADKIFIEEILTKEEDILKIIKYSHNNNKYARNPYLCTSVALNGHLKILKYLHENKFPWFVDTCHSAARNGHLNILKYLHENGCPWNKYTCEVAVLFGHLECLKYLHENKCPLDKINHLFARNNKDLEMIKYLEDQNIKYVINVTD